MLAVVLALAGIALGLRVASPGEYDTELGRVSVRVTPATHGQVEAYIPLADWGVRFHAFRAPMRLHLEPRTVERDVVIRAASGARAPVSATEAGLRTAVKKTVLRTLRFALGGAALLALMLGLGLAAFGVRRRARPRRRAGGRPRDRRRRVRGDARPGPGQLRRACPRPPHLLRARRRARAAAGRRHERARGGRRVREQGAGRRERLRVAAHRPDGGPRRRHPRRRCSRPTSTTTASPSTRCATTRATSPCSSSATSATRAAPTRRACSRPASPGWAATSSRSRATTTRRSSCAASPAAA